MTGRFINMIWLFVTVVLVACSPKEIANDQPWESHVVDASLLGADGARFEDANGDQLNDIATGWEQSGLTRIYFHPGKTDVKSPWKYVTVGISPSVEDAVLVDLDKDGSKDVVSASEGDAMRINFHWAPAPGELYTDSSLWKTEILPVTQGVMQWMFTVPLQVDGKHGVDLIVAGKRDNEKYPQPFIGWLKAPENPRDLSAWEWKPLAEVTWVMSIIISDVNNDGHPDIVFSDRKGASPGVKWLENPGTEIETAAWNLHSIGDTASTVLFMTLDDLDDDGLEDVVVITEDDGIYFIQKATRDGSQWETHKIAFPDRVGDRGKAVTVADINGDGKKDLVLSFEKAEEPKSGVVYLTYNHSVFDTVWQRHEVSGAHGIKYDLVPVQDVDQDGDLDIITTEENNNSKDGKAGLGLIWYENPIIKN